MSADGIPRRSVLAAGSLLPFAAGSLAAAAPSPAEPARLSLNENSFGPAPGVVRAVQTELSRLSRYADQEQADALIRQIARIEQVAPEQVVLGDLLSALGGHLAARAPAGGRFVHSLPGYTALIDAARPLGGVPVAVPLDGQLRNDLPGLNAAIQGDTRALFLVHPHNPSGTVNPAAAFTSFLREAALRTLVIVDEAYLDYDDMAMSAVALTRAGANVAVFRTFDKIYGLAALPLGYALVPRPLADALREAGVGAVHGLGRVTLAAASAALADSGWVRHVRSLTLAGRDRLNVTLDKRGLQRSDSHANFIFFRNPIPADQLRARLAAAGVAVGRAFPPLDEWIRITVGTPAEVDRTIAALDASLTPTATKASS